MYIPRFLTATIEEGLKYNPVTAVIGPRQCGKSTLIKHLIQSRNEILYLDLERPSDLRKLEDAEWFLSSQKDKLICIDEIQRKPELFPILRALVDEENRNGRFLILGSASKDLLRQNSESLAGRITYKQLTPFLWNEINKTSSYEQYINRGGFPRSFLAENNEHSFRWRQDFISTFLERDLLQWSGFLPDAMRRLLQMLAHLNGQTINYSSISKSLGISHTTVKNYIDLLTNTFMVTLLPPFYSNTKKRIVKSPKLYLSDTGITSALLELKSFEQLAGHPVFGSLWESIVFLNLKGLFPSLEFSFYRSSHGAELDLIISSGKKLIAVECKATLSPTLSKGSYNAIEDTKPLRTFIAAPVESGFSLTKNIDVVSLTELTDIIPTLLF